MPTTASRVLRLALPLWLVLGAVGPGRDCRAAGAGEFQKTLHIYLLIGQSNMAGRAPYTREESGSIENCYLLNDEDQWEAAANPLNRYSTIRKALGMQKLNPGYTFAQVMTENSHGHPIGLVVNAKGGTTISQWVKGSHFYEEALRRLNIARKSGSLKGILWHQGEGDRKNARYLDKLATLITDIRNDLNEPNLPFVAGQVTHGEQINALIARLPEAVPATGYAPVDGLTTLDRSHFDAESMKLLGRRYARQMLRIQAD